jgi:hypothetical protein
MGSSTGRALPFNLSLWAARENRNCAKRARVLVFFVRRPGDDDDLYGLEFAFVEEGPPRIAHEASGAAHLIEVGRE